MSNTRVCVVTPVFNGERYLAETIESVRSQSLVNWEYVIMDGGSTDNSVEIAQSYAAVDSRIRVYSHKDQGMYDAVLRGFALTTAPVCCWINADDKLLPWSFETVVEYMEATGAKWLTGVPGYWDQKGRLWQVGSIPWYPRKLIMKGLFHGRALGWIQQESTFFARSLLEQVETEALEDIRRKQLAGDFLLWRQFARFADLDVIPTLLGGFRLHQSNMSGLQSDRYFAEIEEAGIQVPSRLVVRALKLVYLAMRALHSRRRAITWFSAINRTP